jgi:hypothetical protein
MVCRAPFEQIDFGTVLLEWESAGIVKKMKIWVSIRFGYWIAMAEEWR